MRHQISSLADRADAAIIAGKGGAFKTVPGLQWNAMGRLRDGTDERGGSAGRLQAVVYGTVQGVFFRHKTKLEADRLGITGTVRNCVDGTVRVDESGDRKRLEELVTWLHHGPSCAVVEWVDVTWYTDPADQSEFRIAG